MLAEINVSVSNFNTASTIKSFLCNEFKSCFQGLRHHWVVPGILELRLPCV